MGKERATNQRLVKGLTVDSDNQIEIAETNRMSGPIALDETECRFGRDKFKCKYASWRVQ